MNNIEIDWLIKELNKIIHPRNLTFNSIKTIEKAKQEDQIPLLIGLISSMEHEINELIKKIRNVNKR